MVRVTLRLPADVHRRLRAAAARRGTSLNQMVVAAPSQALAREEDETPAERPMPAQVPHIRQVLSDLVSTLELHALPPHLRPSDDLPESKTLRRTLPQLIPPRSAMLVAERGEGPRCPDQPMPLMYSTAAPWSNGTCRNVARRGWRVYASESPSRFPCWRSRRLPQPSPAARAQAP